MIMRIHFIGIGGIGVSALAKYYLAKGHKVTGSDLASSEITKALEKLGVKISFGPHKAKNLPKDANLLVYSPAVTKDNPELKIVRSRTPHIRALSYPKALGELTKKYFTIAVSGTHGKSTTTAMVGLILVKAGFDPTVIVGTKVKEFDDSNCRMGEGQYLVIEADEHFASFLNYWPKIIALTNIEADHLDYYKNFKNYILSFKKYIGHLPKDGVLIANKDDKNVNSIISAAAPNVIYYSLKQDDAKILKKILKVPGEHNVYNALAALTVAKTLKIPDKISFKALSEYRGAWRRFEERELKIARLPARQGNYKLTIVSDYGHHPTEVRATLQAARDKWPNKKIWCVFQPHQYQRTCYLFPEFVKILKRAPVDKLMVTDIYHVAGREKKTIRKKVNSEKLVKAVNKRRVVYLPKKEIIGYLKKNLKGKEVVIFMGAGDIYQVDKKFN